MKKAVFYILLLPILLLIYSAAGCSTEPAELHPVQVSVTPFLGEAASFIALEKGFFRESGLDVTIIRNRNGHESLQQLINNETDIAHLAETPYLHYLIKKAKNPHVMPIVILAEMMLVNDIQKIVARRDSGINRPDDIQGKRVGFTPNTQSEYFLDSFLLEYQLTKTDVDLQPMPVPDQVRALTAGEVDAIAVWEPHAAETALMLGENALKMQTRLTYSTLWMAFASRELSQTDPQILESYLSALFKAQKFIRDNPAESKKILAEYISSPPEVIEELWDQIDFKLLLTERMLFLIEDQIQWAHSRGYEVSRPDWNAVIFPDALKKVNPNGYSLFR